jgi:hypothetical protein
MDSSVSAKDVIWFLRVCHHISNAVYLAIRTPHCVPFQSERYEWERVGTYPRNPIPHTSWIGPASTIADWRGNPSANHEPSHNTLFLPRPPLVGRLGRHFATECDAVISLYDGTVPPSCMYLYPSASPSVPRVIY